MCKLPLSVEVWGYTNEVRLRGLIFSLPGAGFVCGRAISNRPVFLLALGCSPPVTEKKGKVGIIFPFPFPLFS